ncbi:MAG TPA: hypothetical protein VFB42_01670 [Gaiellaceae bacterium]|nr:hypothetical protein [Gaiellaceae bacterium]
MAKRLVLGQLASVGEGAIGRLAQNPVTHKALEGALQLKDRVEKLVKGLETLEERLAAVEQRLDALERRRAPARKPAARKAPAAKPAAGPEQAATGPQGE